MRKYLKVWSFFLQFTSTNLVKSFYLFLHGIKISLNDNLWNLNVVDSMFSEAGGIKIHEQYVILSLLFKFIYIHHVGAFRESPNTF